EEMRHARQRLGGDQRPLGLAVKILGPALRGQRAAMQLEIHLADPYRQGGLLVDLGADLLVPVGNVDRSGGRHDPEIGELALSLEHLLRRPAAAIAIAEGEQALAAEMLAAVVAPGLDDGARAGLGVVAADGIVEGVREYAAAVEALPPEQVVGH